MRVATTSEGNPQSGASPAMSSKSGKPLKNRPKNPPRSPGTNHRGECVAVGGAIEPVALKRYRTLSQFLRATGGRQWRRDRNEDEARPANPTATVPGAGIRRWECPD